MTDTRVHRLGAGLLAATGVLHLVLAPEYLQEHAYIGVLFILGGLTALAVAARLWRTDDRLAWGVGAAIATGMAVGLVLSRTPGLPGSYESEWELAGLVSLLVELAFVGTLGWQLRNDAAVLQAP